MSELSNCETIADMFQLVIDKITEDRRNLLTWLAQKEYLCQVFEDEDEDINGNRTYETVTQYLDVDEVLEEYENFLKEQKND